MTTVRMAMPLALAATLVPGSATLCVARAQDTANPWTVTWENDAFLLGESTDVFYTNGIRIAISLDSASLPTRASRFADWWVARFGREKPHVTTVSYVLGHTFFTPTEITTYRNDPLDRPFAGLLFAGMRMDMTEAQAELRTRPTVQMQQSLEIDAGIMGPEAGARELQAGVHVIRQNRIPKGWRQQVPFRFAPMVNYTWRAMAGSHFLDIVPQLGVMVGLPQSNFYAGGVARLGWNMTAYPIRPITPTVPMIFLAQRSPPPDWDLFGFLGTEARYMMLNEYMRGVDYERLVQDRLAGVSFRLTDWRFTYTRVLRSPELADGPYRRSHTFASVALAYEPNGRTKADRAGTFVGCFTDVVLGTILSNLSLDVGLGTASITGAGGSGLAMRASLGRRIGDRLTIGGELSGAVREGAAPANLIDDHTDLFLRSRLFTVAISPFGTQRKIGALQVRGGLGSSGRRLQVTPGTPGIRSSACPVGTILAEKGRTCNLDETSRATMLALGYSVAVSGRMRLGIDHSWHRTGFNGPDSFRSLTAGFSWQP